MKRIYELNVVNRCSYGLEGAYKKNESIRKEGVSTEWHYLSAERAIHSSSARSIFIKDSRVTLLSERQKLSDDNQRPSVLQQLNQAQAQGTEKFVEVICSLQDKKEDFKKNKKQIKLFSCLKKITKLFSSNKEIFTNGSKICNDEFIYFSPSRL